MVCPLALLAFYAVAIAWRAPPSVGPPHGGGACSGVAHLTQNLHMVLWPCIISTFHLLD
eukprot:SAG31_NODE_28669_length_406_cov_1.674267_1_plen_58_part_10